MRNVNIDIQSHHNVPRSKTSSKVEAFPRLDKVSRNGLSLSFEWVDGYQPYKPASRQDRWEELKSESEKWMRTSEKYSANLKLPPARFANFIRRLFENWKLFEFQKFKRQQAGRELIKFDLNFRMRSVRTSRRVGKAFVQLKAHWLDVRRHILRFEDCAACKVPRQLRSSNRSSSCVYVHLGTAWAALEKCCHKRLI